MKNFIAIFVILYIMSVLMLRNTTAASPLGNSHFEDNSLDDDERALSKELEGYIDKDMEGEELPYLNLQKRRPSSYKYLKSCVPRGGNCDHRPNNCCNSSSCRCNLWGANCKCQRMGFFQRWGK